MNVVKVAIADILNYQVNFVSVNNYFESPISNRYQLVNDPYSGGRQFIDVTQYTPEFYPVIPFAHAVTLLVFDPTFDRFAPSGSEYQDINTHDVTLYLNIDPTVVKQVLTTSMNSGNPFGFNLDWFHSPFWPYFSGQTWLNLNGEAVSYAMQANTSSYTGNPLTVSTFFSLLGITQFTGSFGNQHWEWNGTSIDGATIDYAAGNFTSSLGYGIGYSDAPLVPLVKNHVYDAFNLHGGTFTGGEDSSSPSASTTPTWSSGGIAVGGGGSGTAAPTLSIGPVKLTADVSTFRTTVSLNLLKSTTAVYDATSNTTTITDIITAYPRNIYLASIEVVPSPIGNGYVSVTIIDSVFSASSTITYNTWYTLRVVPPTNITGIEANLVYSTTNDAWGNFASAATGYNISLDVVIADATHPNMALRYNFIDTAGNSFSYVSSEPLVEINVGSLNSKYQLGIQVPVVKDVSGTVIPDYYGTKTTVGVNPFISNLVYVGEGHGPV